MSLYTVDRLAAGPFLDICAGSGITGFEALSRGAPQVVFIEVDGQMARSIRVAAKAFGISEYVKVIKGDVRRCLKRVNGAFEDHQRAACGFLDPPFIQGLAGELLAKLDQARGLFAPDALVIVRTPDELPAALDSFALIERRKSKRAPLWLYQASAAN